MPVPSSISDLSTTASSNSPAGGDTPKDGDNYIRAHASFIATLRDKLDGTSATGTINAATFTGTHTFGGNLTSGTYTPTLTNVSNATTLSVPAAWSYQRIGSVVFVTGVLVSAASSTGDTTLRATLPVATDFTTAVCAGVANRVPSSAVAEAGRVGGDASTDEVIVAFRAAVTAASSVYVAFSYSVV